MPNPMLEGVTVLDLASVGPAARASGWLADYGATVVKVGPVPAKADVQIAPAFFAYSGHRGMKRVLVDLKAADGREAFLRLADKADVLVEGFRPGVVDRLGIGYPQVSERNPRTIYCSTSGFGQDGPAAQWAGHDLNYLAVGGFLDCTQPRADGGPPVPGATFADGAGGGMHAVIAILAALVRRGQTGEGAYLDVSVADGVLALMALQVDEFLATGTKPGPGHNIISGRYACYDAYPSRDGRWLSVAAIEAKFWTNLCRLLGLDKWAAAQLDDDVQNDIRADLRAAFATRDRDEWIQVLAPADTCVAPVLSVPELVQDVQYAAGAIVTAIHPEHGRFQQVGPTLAGMLAPEAPCALPDGKTTDTEELLLAAGLSAAEVARLCDAGVVK